jgi:hypothetical protein
MIDRPGKKHNPGLAAPLIAASGPANRREMKRPSCLVASVFPIYPPVEFIGPLAYTQSREPVKPEDLAATIYAAMGIGPETEIHDNLNRPHSLILGQPIKALLP